MIFVIRNPYDNIATGAFMDLIQITLETSSNLIILITLTLLSFNETL